jgi:hypothetical protein
MGAGIAASACLLLVAGCGQAAVAPVTHHVAQKITGSVQYEAAMVYASNKREARVQSIARKAVARLNGEARKQQRQSNAASGAGGHVSSASNAGQNPTNSSSSSGGATSSTRSTTAGNSATSSPASANLAARGHILELTPARISSIVAGYLASQRAKTLLYRSGLGSVAGWTPFGVGAWFPYKYAQPVDGKTQLLRYEGDSRASLTAPFTVPSSNYAVEAQIRWLRYVNPNAYPSSGFGLFIRARGPLRISDGQGIIAGVRYIKPPRNFGPPRQDYSWATIGRPGQVATPTGSFITNFSSGSGWHTYRLEVRGPNMTLFIDDMEAAQMTSNHNFMGRHIGIYSLGAKIEVAHFQVHALIGAGS